MKKSLLIILFLLFFVGIHNSFAAAPSWEIDKAHANFYFSVDHIFSKVQGHFRDFTGTILFDPEKPAESSFVFEIKVGSINTDNAKRDKHLLSGDFFDEGKFPVILFRSETITATTNDTFTIEGKFTIKGQEHALTFPLTLAGIKEHPAMQDTLVAGFNGNLIIDRLAHGVGGGKFYEMGLVGKDVDIFISLEVLRKK